MIASLNLMYSGSEDDTVCLFQPSAAQRRCWVNLGGAVHRFFSAAEGWPDLAQIHEFLRHDEGYMPASTVARPLGGRGGVPATAAGVDLAGLLRPSRPQVADQVTHPSALLLPASERPRRL